MPNSKKIAQVETIADLLKKNKNFILLKYSGVPTATFDGLRKKLKETNTILTIIKNSLFEKAINNLMVNNKFLKNLKDKYFPLKDPTAVIYLGNDWSPPLKAYYQFTQGLTGFSFKIGVLDDSIYDENQLKKVAQLPTESELIVKLLNSFNSPNQRLVYAMKFNINKLVYILKRRGGDQ